VLQIVFAQRYRRVLLQEFSTPLNAHDDAKCSNVHFGALLRPLLKELIDEISFHFNGLPV
jgi:hypothetical protein